MKSVYIFIKDKFSGSSKRSKEALKGSLLSVLAKMISVLSSLLIVPLTIDYVNPTQYGIWLTLSSIIGWVTFFDLGLGNGFRNRFAEAKAKGDLELAKRYLSTTYFAVFAIVFVVFVILLCITVHTVKKYRDIEDKRQKRNKIISLIIADCLVLLLVIVVLILLYKGSAH